MQSLSNKIQCKSIPRRFSKRVQLTRDQECWTGQIFKFALLSNRRTRAVENQFHLFPNFSRLLEIR